MKIGTKLSALAALSALSACGGSTTGPTPVEIAASEEALRIFSDGTGDFGDAFADGDTVTARTISTSGITRDYNSNSSAVAAPEVQVLRNASGELSIIIDGTRVDFDTGDRFVEPGGEIYGYEIRVPNVSFDGVWSWSGELDEALASGNGYAKVFTYYLEANQTEGADIGFAVVGTETQASGIPTTGSATFEGYSVIRLVPANDLTDFGGQRRQVRGDVMMDVGFADQTVAGTIDNLEFRAAGSNTDVAVAGSIAMEETTFNEFGFQGDLTLDATGQASFEVDDGGVGQYSGAFYGNDATEVGGAITGSIEDSEDGTLNAYGFFKADNY